MSERTTGYGCPCGKCGETILIYHDDKLPPLDDKLNLAKFTYAVGERKGKVIAPHDDASLCPNGCQWTPPERMLTFFPPRWNEIRTD
jgi:hypothetical protein